MSRIAGTDLTSRFLHYLSVLEKWNQIGGELLAVIEVHGEENPKQVLKAVKKALEQQKKLVSEAFKVT